MPKSLFQLNKDHETEIRLFYGVCCTEGLFPDYEYDLIAERAEQYIKDSIQSGLTISCNSGMLALGAVALYKHDPIVKAVSRNMHDGHGVKLNKEILSIMQDIIQ